MYFELDKLTNNDDPIVIPNSLEGTHKNPMLLLPEIRKFRDLSLVKVWLISEPIFVPMPRFKKNLQTIVHSH